MHASKLVLNQEMHRVLNSGPLMTYKRRRELKIQRVKDYIRKQPVGTKIQPKRLIYEAGYDLSRNYAAGWQFVDGLVRTGIITRERIPNSDSAYFTVPEDVKVTTPASKLVEEPTPKSISTLRRERSDFEVGDVVELPNGETGHVVKVQIRGVKVKSDKSGYVRPYRRDSLKLITSDSLDVVVDEMTDTPEEVVQNLEEAVAAANEVIHSIDDIPQEVLNEVPLKISDLPEVTTPEPGDKVIDTAAYAPDHEYQDFLFTKRIEQLAVKFAWDQDSDSLRDFIRSLK